MRKVRSRLTILLLILVAVSSAVSILLAILAMGGKILGREDSMRAMMFGFAVKDVILLLVVITVVFLLLLMVSRSTTNPILELNRAIRQVADGNYDVKVNIRDKVEEFGELQKNFNTMVEQLQSNAYLRKDFIANVSHELKTPLSIMSGYAELLAQGGLTEQEQKEYADLISDEAKRLITMTSNMLRLSSMEHEQVRMERRTFSLDEQIRQAVLSLEPKWSGKEQNVTLELEEISYTGDEELLYQVWLNLAGNAVKFTPSGGSIGLRLTGDGQRITVTVSDNGPGMDQETMQRMFEQFYRGDTDCRFEGSGLGLPLAKRVVQLHGGDISAQSTPGAGSVFTVCLPMAQI